MLLLLCCLLLGLCLFLMLGSVLTSLISTRGRYTVCWKETVCQWECQGTLSRIGDLSGLSLRALRTLMEGVHRLDDKSLVRNNSFELLVLFD